MKAPEPKLKPAQEQDIPNEMKLFRKRMRDYGLETSILKDVKKNVHQVKIEGIDAISGSPAEDRLKLLIHAAFSSEEIWQDVIEFPEALIVIDPHTEQLMIGGFDPIKVVLGDTPDVLYKLDYDSLTDIIKADFRDIIKNGEPVTDVSEDIILIGGRNLQTGLFSLKDIPWPCPVYDIKEACERIHPFTHTPIIQLARQMSKDIGNGRKLLPSGDILLGDGSIFPIEVDPDLLVVFFEEFFPIDGEMDGRALLSALGGDVLVDMIAMRDLVDRMICEIQHMSDGRVDVVEAIESIMLEEIGESDPEYSDPKFKIARKIIDYLDTHIADNRDLLHTAIELIDLHIERTADIEDFDDDDLEDGRTIH